MQYFNHFIFCKKKNIKQPYRRVTQEVRPVIEEVKRNIFLYWFNNRMEMFFNLFLGSYRCTQEWGSWTWRQWCWSWWWLRRWRRWPIAKGLWTTIQIEGIIHHFSEVIPHNHTDYCQLIQCKLMNAFEIGVANKCHKWIDSLCIFDNPLNNCSLSLPHRSAWSDCV